MFGVYDEADCTTGHSVSAASIDICFVYKQLLINSDMIYN